MSIVINLITINFGKRSKQAKKNKRDQRELISQNNSVGMVILDIRSYYLLYRKRDGMSNLIDGEGGGGDGEGGAGGGGAGEDGGGDDVFHGLLNDATHRASTHLGIVALFD